MLALQADLLSEDPAILFGHKSFREFLVGRYWAAQLRRLIHASSDQPSLWPPMRDGRLLALEDRSVVFLCDILLREEVQPDTNQPTRVLHELMEWLEQQFQDSLQDFPLIGVARRRRSAEI